MPYPQVVADLLVGETGDLNIADGTDSGFTASLDLSNLTADRTLTLPDSDADIGLTTDSVGTDEIDLSITPTWTGSHTFNADLTLGMGGVDYAFTSTSSLMEFSSQGSGNNFALRLYNSDQDGTKNTFLELYGVGGPVGSSDRERLRINYDSSGQMDIASEAAGTGTTRPLHVYTGSNTNQLTLSTGGNVNMESGTLGVGTGVDAQDTSFSAHFGSSGVRSDGKIDLNNSSAIQDAGTDALTFDGSQNVTVPNGNLKISNPLQNGSGTQLLNTSPSSAYSPSNVTTDRTYDANSTTQAELADVLGTLIADLQTHGLIG